MTSTDGGNAEIVWNNFSKIALALYGQAARVISIG